MDRLADLEANRAVRRILVRHWVDLGKLTVRTILGVVSVSGTMYRLPAARSPLNGTVVSAILSEIRRAPNVRRVRANLVNWEIGVDGWKETAPQVGTPSAPAAMSPSAG